MSDIHKKNYYIISKFLKIQKLTELRTGQNSDKRLRQQCSKSCKKCNKIET